MGPGREGVEKTLRTTKDREYAAAKNAWRAILAIHVVSVAAAVFGALEPSASMGVALGLWAFAGPLAMFLLRRWAGERYRVAERIRRLELLHEGLGRAPSRMDLAMLSVDAPTMPIIERAPLLPYFTSDAPEGCQRLLHIVQQSAFFTRRIAALSARYCWIGVGLGVVVTVALLLMAIRDPGQAAGPDAAGFDGELLSQVAATLLAFFSAGVFAEFASSFGTLGRVANDTVVLCAQHLEQPTDDPWSYYPLLSDYDSALASAPPLPALVYAVHRTRIENAWREFGAERDAAKEEPE